MKLYESQADLSIGQFIKHIFKENFINFPILKWAPYFSLHHIIATYAPCLQQIYLLSSNELNKTYFILNNIKIVIQNYNILNIDVY